MADEQKKENPSALVNAARKIGSAVGKVAAVTHLAGPDVKKAPEAPAPENLYKADYLGSGTFIIHKPKRVSAKLRQSRLKGPRRGARK